MNLFITSLAYKLEKAFYFATFFLKLSRKISEFMSKIFKSNYKRVFYFTEIHNYFFHTFEPYKKLKNGNSNIRRKSSKNKW